MPEATLPQVIAAPLMPEVRCVVVSASSSILVRLATRSDIGTLVASMREAYAEASYPLDQRWAEAAFEKLFEDSDRGCGWIAEYEGAAAGHAVLTLRYAMEHGALSGHIDDLFVRPELRRRGIGHALVSASASVGGASRCTWK